MAGVKGRSGRRPEGVNQKRLKIIDKAWDVVMDFISDPKQPKKERVEIAKTIAAKNIPSDVNIDALVQYTKMGEIIIDDKPKEFDIGATPNTGHTR